MLKNNNFKYLWFGRLISNAGDSIYYIVLSWYILQMTQSPVWVGIINFSIFIPNIFSFLFGHYIDTHNNKRILIFLESGQLISIIILAIVVFLEINNPILICLIAFSASTFGMNTYTVQDVMMPKLVEYKDLTKAQTYMSFSYNGTEYLFNALSGFLINFLSIFSLLLINVGTFFISILSFLKIKYLTTEDRNISESIVEKEKPNKLAGFTLIYKEKSIFLISIGGSIANFLFGGLNVYLVLVAGNQNSPIILGLMTSSMAVGILIGSTVGVSLMSKFLPHGKSFILSTFLYGAGMICSSFLISSSMIIIALGIANVFLGITHVLQKPYFQVLIPQADLGKVFSALYSISIGTLPLGSLLFGIIASQLSSRYFLIIFGFSYIGVSIMYFFNKSLYNFDLKFYESTHNEDVHSLDT